MNKSTEIFNGLARYNFISRSNSVDPQRVTNNRRVTFRESVLLGVTCGRQFAHILPATNC
ncbi:hypothetical protein PUN28_018938 [Cardiocondyla obscurior]|uniref:Uncharacterized protein n=1 Tax=Cardiocondyla obscurior TaxID=286306 RepID=A0AAW2ECN0_9HYME